MSVSPVRNRRAGTVLAVAGVALMLGVACTDDRDPIGSAGQGQPPTYAFWDGAHGLDGNPNFFFLPPMVADPSGHEEYDPDGFNPDMIPEVRICALDVGTALCTDDPSDGFPIVFTMHTGPGSETVRVTAEHYQVNWHTTDWNLQTGTYYRIEVYIGSELLGYADVDVVGTGKELRSVETTEFIPLLDGRTLPIKFRIEDGVLCDPAASACAEEVVTASEDEAIVLIDQAAEEYRVELPAQPGGFPVEQDGQIVYVQEVTVALETCQVGDTIPVSDPKYGGCLLVTVEPKLAAPLTAPATVSICGLEDLPPEPYDDLLTMYRFDVVDGDSVITALKHVPDNCSPFYGSVESAGLKGYALRGWRSLRDGFLGLLSPEPLHALGMVFHRGAGGETDLFSTFQFIMPTQFPDLVSWWPLDGNLVDVFDFFFFEFNAGNAYVSGSLSHVPGLVNRALAFDGSGATAVIPTHADLQDLQQFTVAAWVQLDPDGPADAIQRFVTLGDPTNQKAVLRQDGANSPRQFHFYADVGDSLPGVRVDNALRTGCYHHVAGSYDGTTLRAYLDGVEVGSTPATGTSNSAGDALALSYGDPDEEFLGLMDEVVVYSRALDPAEIEAFYDAGGDGKCLPFPPVPLGEPLVFSSDRGGNLDVYVMHADGSGLMQLTTNPANDGFPALAPDGQTVAFVSNRSNNFDIWTMNIDGTGLTQLTMASETDSAPAWSPDGTRIVFRSERDWAAGTSEIYVMNADGSGQTNLSNHLAYDGQPSWSPSGSHIVFVSHRDGNNADVFVMNADGSGVTNLTAHPAHDGKPVWSPDGSQILFPTDRDGNWEIYAMAPDGTGLMNLTNHPGIDIFPAWAPDGTVAFVSFRTGNYDVWVMNADGSRQVNLTKHPARDHDVAWRQAPPPPPLTEPLAFSSDRDGNWEIYAMNVDGSALRRVTYDAAADGGPAISPDGQKIAFVSDRSGHSDIWTMNIDGTDLHQVTTYTGVDTAPAWSPDGTQIAFHRRMWGEPPQAVHHVFTVNADGSGEVDRFTGVLPRWSPDGLRFVFSKWDGGEPNFGDIFVANVDGTGIVNLTNHEANDSKPAWSPDGLRIVFTSTRGGDYDIWVMNADGSSPTCLTNSPGIDQKPDWSADGQTIAYVRWLSPENTEIWTMHVDGSNQVNRTAHPARDQEPGLRQPSE